MKAVLQNGIGNADVLYVGNAEKPEPGTGQVRIRVVAASVNRPDIVQREGNYPPPQGESEILGLDVAGTIDALGPGVTDWKVGDRVMALLGGGGYAEFALAHGGHVMPIPETMSFEEAACVCETYITAYLNLFMLGAMVDGETVLLHGGGGGVNTASIQLCQALTPTAKMIVTASPGKVDRVKQLGVHHVINYKDEDFADRVREVTNDRGADVILDHIGAAYLKSNLKSLATGGRLLVIGVMGGSKAELNLAVLMVKRHQIIGSVLRSRPVEEKARIISEFAHVVLPFFAERKIVPLIHAVYGLDEVAKAHQAMETGAHFGKIVLSVSK